MLPDLESLRCFEEAARQLNFRAAAKAVGLTPAALGQRIRRLEEQLEVPLFHRTTRQVRLTAEGMALLPAARKTLQSAQDCVRAARGELGLPPMDLRLGTRYELGMSWVVPLVERIETELPELRVHLYFGAGSDLDARLRGRELDCAISSRRLEDPDLDGYQLHREDYVFVGAPALLSERPMARAEDATSHTLLDIDPSRPLFRYWQGAPGGAEPLRFGGLRSLGTIGAIRRLSLEGQGLAVLPAYLVTGDLADGTLVQVLPDVTLQHDWFRLLFRGDDPRRLTYRRLAGLLKQAPMAASGTSPGSCLVTRC